MASSGRRVVLLAEDDPLQRDVLQEVLEFEGYRVRVATSPGEVLGGLQEGPDLVLLDVVGLVSAEVEEALARGGRRPPVLLVSADPALPEVAARLGVEGFLAKPYDLELLLQILSDVLEGRAPLRPAAAQSDWAGAHG